MTAGNLEHRYLGCKTDEPLCPEGIAFAKQQAKQGSFPLPEQVFVSPMQRCRETASILFPNLEQQIHPDLRECDFGMFEGKNYRELSGCPEYQAWIDSGGTLPFPDGESREQFLTRSCAAVSKIVQTCNSDRIAIVAHGGTMMAVFSACEMHQKSYFDWKIPHCEPFLCEVFRKNPLQLQWKERN